MQRRKMRQIALALLSWALFAYYWWLVSRRRLNPETLAALTILIVAIGTVWLVTLFWIRHNQLVARRAGDRRKKRRMPPPELSTDTLGRRIELVGELAPVDARYVEIAIDLEDGIKRYRGAEHPPEGRQR